MVSKYGKVVRFDVAAASQISLTAIEIKRASCRVPTKCRVPKPLSRWNLRALTPDRRFLQVVDAMGRYVWSYKIQDDGSLISGQPYFYVHAPQDDMNTGADGCTMTQSGELIVATKLGVQLFDQPGRAHVILSRPKRDGRLSNVVFAGDDMKTLYVTSGTSVYRRQTNMKGIAPWQTAVKPDKPRL